MRTEQQISDEMDRVQAQFPELTNLTSKSNASVFGLLRNIWIALQLTLDHYIDGVRAELVATAAAVQVGSLNWYVDQVKAFQYGDPLALVGGKPGYDVIDGSKRVVTQAAVIETDGRLQIKVAKPKDDANQALSDAELISLKDYVRAIKYAGVAVDVVSLPPDELRIDATVRYNRQVLDSSGRFLTGTERRPVNEVISVYIRSLPFDSVFSWTAVSDIVRTFEGVDDFIVNRTFIRPGGATEWTEFTRQTQSRAGHMKLIESNLSYV